MVEGWTIFETAQTACFASKFFADNVGLILGRMKGSGDFILGMLGNVPSPEGRTLTLVFDGTRRRQPYVERYGKTVVGRYRDDAGLVEEISRSAELRVLGEKLQVATLPLVGTRAAVAAVENCVRSMPPSDINGGARADMLPANSLCDDKPKNGQLLTKRGGVRAQGHRITVRNSMQGDAIVKVRHEQSGKLAYSFIVNRNEEASINGIADGNYRLQFAYGQILLENCTDFLNPQASEFDRSVPLTTHVDRTKKAVTTYTKTYTVTLYAVKDGNLTTSTIDQSEFLKD